MLSKPHFRHARLFGFISALFTLWLWTQPAAAQSVTHVVQPGETLSQICYTYGSDAQALINANGIVNPNFIYVGQELVIP